MTGAIRYASELAAKGLNLQPIGTPHEGAHTSCAMCGRSIQVGDISAPLTLTHTFTDWLSLTPSEHVCGWCEVTRIQANMRALQRAVITNDGIYPMGKDDHRAWFLLTPPEPPYAVVLNNAAATAVFHLHWRTPLTLSNELVVLRIDGIVTSIRRRVLMKAIDQCQEMATLMHERRPVGKRGAAKLVPARHPFACLDRSLSDTRHGRLRDDAIAAAAGRPDLLEAMRTLSIGELWALATLVKAKPPIPTRPDLITSPKLPANTPLNVDV